MLRGSATIRAEVEQDLSSFNLDLIGLNVRYVAVNGRPARWSRNGGELTITPRKGLRDGKDFTTVIVHDGVPQTIDEGILGLLGFIHTDDGTLVAGQPDSAAYWYPVNDHPLDKASYTFELTVPRGLEAIANGVLTDVDHDRRTTTWEWKAKEPMASYLTTATIGEFDIDAYRADGIAYWDAIDPDLLASPGPAQRVALRDLPDRRAVIQAPDANAERALKWRNGVVLGPARHRAELGLLLCRGAHGRRRRLDHAARLGRPRDPGHGRRLQRARGPVPVRRALRGPRGHRRLRARGHEGRLVGGLGRERRLRAVDRRPLGLRRQAGRAVRSRTPATTSTSTQASSSTTSRCRSGPGRRRSRAASGAGRCPGRRRAASRTPTTGSSAAPRTRRARAGRREGGLLDATGDHPLPVRDLRPLPVLGRGRHIWLNEAFATYSERLWSEHKGRATAQDYFDFYASTPADDPFWSVVIGDPGPELLFDGAVYDRGAMTLHALRGEIGDPAFFRLLREWVRENAGGNVAIGQFIAMAERIAGRELDDFLRVWLFTGAKPAGIEPQVAARVAPAAPGARVHQGVGLNADRKR